MARWCFALMIAVAGCTRAEPPVTPIATRTSTSTSTSTSKVSRSSPTGESKLPPPYQGEGWGGGSTQIAASLLATRNGDDVVRGLARLRPHAWGDAVPGVHTRLAEAGAVALTFDACGGPGGDGYDARLIALLRREAVPATLFLSARWIDSHPELAAELAADPLFEIENHGRRHRPCSITGRGAYGLRGTRNLAEAVDEIRGGAERIRALTGAAPRFYRAGTAHYDDVCARAATELGQTPIGFTVSGDAARGWSAPRIREALVHAPAGAVVLLHMNHPYGGTADGVAAALPELAASGVRFVRLGDVTTR